MDVEKTKKAKMQAVKKCVFVVLLLTAGCIAIAPFHNIIRGTFYLEGGFNDGFSGNSYTFNDSTFSTVTSGDLGGIEDKAGGNYDIRGDTLILYYEPLKGPESATYTFESSEPIPSPAETDSLFQEDTLGTVMFQVINRNGEPIPDATIVLQDPSQEVVKEFSPDMLGRFPKLTIQQHRYHFRFIYLGSSQVIIPTDALAGYHSKIRVLLTRITHSQYKGIKKFQIKEARKDRIILQRLEGDKERVVLVREGSDN